MNKKHKSLLKKYEISRFDNLDFKMCEIKQNIHTSFVIKIKRYISDLICAVIYI